MKKLIMIPLTFVFLLVVSCGKNTKPTDLATQAMERARAAEANIYAPVEYTEAEEMYNEMLNLIQNNKQKDANELAPSVVDKANEATRIARQNKANEKILELEELLRLAKSINLDQNAEENLAQAELALMDAKSYYSNGDYENALDAAESGISILNTLLGGQKDLAQATLERAKNLLHQAQTTTDTNQSQVYIDQASEDIDIAGEAFNTADYATSIHFSSEAIRKLEDILAKFAGNQSINIRVSEQDNLQLQAYDLIKSLGDTIKYLKDNGFTNAVYPNAMPSSNESDKELEAIEKEADEMGDTFTDPNYEYESTEEYNEKTYGFISAPMSFKAQSAEQDVITIQMIEEYYTSAQAAYNEGNYLNAIDLAREGLRLSEVFLAGQTLTTHKVVRGDTLWDISGKIYKKRRFWLWPNIWRANKLQIKDPDLIYPNQVFRIPPAPIAE